MLSFWWSGKGQISNQGWGREGAEDTEVASSEDTEFQVSLDPGQSRQAPGEGQ